MSDYEDRARKRMQRKQDDFDEDRKYVKNYRGDWSLKPSYTTHELNKVKGPKKNTRRQELEKDAKEYALRRLSRMDK